MRTHRHRGFSLVELLVALGVLLLIAAALAGTARLSRDDARAEAFASDLSQMVVNIKDRYRLRLSYTGLTSFAIASDRVAPAALINDATTTLTSPWGQIDVTAADARGEGSPNAFSIWLPAQMPPTACLSAVRAVKESIVGIARFGRPPPLSAGNRITASNENTVLSAACVQPTAALVVLTLE